MVVRPKFYGACLLLGKFFRGGRYLCAGMIKKLLLNDTSSIKSIFCIRGRIS